MARTAKEATKATKPKAAKPTKAKAAKPKATTVASVSAPAGPVVLVTGAAGGLGRALAQAFAEDGAQLALTDRDGPAVEGVAAALRRRGHVARAFALDVTDEAALGRLVDTVEAELGPLAVAINNAGTSQPGADTDAAELDRVFAVNLSGVRHALKHQLRVMRPRQAGVIVNVSSNVALHPWLGQSIYAASKAALLGLTRSAARLVAREGIRINAICPGGIPTPMLLGSSGGEAGLRFLAHVNPAGRLAEPDEVARGIVWMCRPEAAYMIGHAIGFDGGVTSW
jgi:NAD(P)-dependent dehydrogenase (short-subunit alcohol dehydrogenase family)